MQPTTDKHYRTDNSKLNDGSKLLNQHWEHCDKSLHRTVTLLHYSETCKAKENSSKCRISNHRDRNWRHKTVNGVKTQKGLTAQYNMSQESNWNGKAFYILLQCLKYKSIPERYFLRLSELIKDFTLHHLLYTQVVLLKSMGQLTCEVSMGVSVCRTRDLNCSTLYWATMIFSLSSRWRQHSTVIPSPQP